MVTYLKNFLSYGLTGFIGKEFNGLIFELSDDNNFGKSSIVGCIILPSSSNRLLSDVDNTLMVSGTDINGSNNDFRDTFTTPVVFSTFNIW